MQLQLMTWVVRETLCCVFDKRRLKTKKLVKTFEKVVPLLSTYLFQQTHLQRATANIRDKTRSFMTDCIDTAHFTTRSSSNANDSCRKLCLFILILIQGEVEIHITPTFCCIPWQVLQVRHFIVDLTLCLNKVISCITYGVPKDK